MGPDSHAGAVQGVREPRVLGEPQADPKKNRPAAPMLAYSQVRGVVLMMCFAAVFGSMVALPPVIGMNDASRWSTAWAISVGNGFVIDGTPYDTCDKVFRDGHFYSSKPALMPSVVGGLLYWVTLFNQFPIRGYERIFVRIILLIINVLPLLLMIYFYDKLLEKWKVSAPVRFFCLIAMAFGTYVTAYSTTLNNHTQAAWALFFSLYCLVHILENPDAGYRWYVGCGMFASWTAVNENPAIAYVLIVAVLLLMKYPRKTLAYFVPVLALFTIAYFYTTYLSTGRLYPYSLNYDKETYYTYPGTVWLNPRGIDSLNEPKLWYAFNLILGHHGLLSLTPIFLLGLWGLLRRKDAFTAAHQTINAMGLALVLSISLLYIIATKNYGGGCQGPRWLIWLTPFFLIALPQVMQKHYSSRFFRTFAYLTLLVSIYSISYALVKGPWGDSRDSWLHWIFRYMQWIQGY